MRLALSQRRLGQRKIGDEIAVAEHESAPVAGVLGDLDQDVADDPRDRAGLAVHDLDELPRRSVQQSRQRRFALHGLNGALLTFVHRRIIPLGTATGDSLVPIA